MKQNYFKSYQFWEKLLIFQFQLNFGFFQIFLSFLQTDSTVSLKNHDNLIIKINRSPRQYPKW